MSKEGIELPWGPETLAFDLPAGWEKIGTMEPAAAPPCADLGAELGGSLARPFGTPRLAELASGARRVALVIDDDSRPTPVASILPAVLAELAAAGIDASMITVIPALGLHRPMRDEEVVARLGVARPGAASEGFRIATHLADDPSALSFLGTTSRGTPVHISRVVAEADLIVGIGCIEPHIIAGAGGGAKILVPGVAGRATIAHNHSLNCRPETFNSVGRAVEDNPMRLDLEEAAAMLGPPVFIVNAVLNARKEVVRIVCGHPVAAHREGARASLAIFGVRIPALADVVIASSNPMDQDLRQGMKSLANTIGALRRGGTMIVMVRAEEGVGVFGLANAKLPLGRRTLKFLAPLLLPLIPKIRLSGLGEEDRFFLYFALQAMSRAELLIVAPTIPAGVKANVPFARFPESLEEAVDIARRRHPRGAKVLLFPYGGSTFPIGPD
jgi:nickel-dependent lactate racemase